MDGEFLRIQGTSETDGRYHPEIGAQRAPQIIRACLAAAMLPPSQHIPSGAQACLSLRPPFARLPAPAFWRSSTSTLSLRARLALFRSDNDADLAAPAIAHSVLVRPMLTPSELIRYYTVSLFAKSGSESRSVPSRQQVKSPWRHLAHKCSFRFK